MRNTTLLIAGLLLALIQTAAAQDKKILDHDAYEIWNRIDNRELSKDGSAIAVSFGPENQDKTLQIHQIETGSVHVVSRGVSPAFSADSRYAAFLIKPQKEAVRQAKLNGQKKDELPADSLGIVTVSTGYLERIANVKSFKLPEDDGPYVAYLLNKDMASDTTATDSVSTSNPEGAKDASKAKRDKEKPEGTRLILRHLTTGVSHAFEHVTDYQFAKDGRRLYYTASEKTGTFDGVFQVTTATGFVEPIVVGAGAYEQLAVSESGKRVAFVSDREDQESTTPLFAVFLQDDGSSSVRRVADVSTPGMPAGWSVSNNHAVEFSKGGGRLFFGTAPIVAEPDTSVKILDDEKVVVDVWNWKDTRIQPMQSVQREKDLKLSFKAVAAVKSGTNRIVQLATPDRPDVTIGNHGDALIGIAATNVPYQTESSWDFPNYNDVYLVNIETGKADRVLERIQSSAALSPAERFVTFWDRDELTWKAYSVESGAVIDMGVGIHEPLQNELHDWPYKANGYGNAGWTRNDKQFLIYDNFDLWAVDPSRPGKPVSITDQAGRREKLRFRYVRLDPDEQFVADTEPLLLSVFNTETKASGFYTDQLGAKREPARLVYSNHSYSTPVKAANADVVMLTREDFDEFPDVWSAATDLSSLRKITELNPQKSEYRWGTAELVSWTSLDGVPLRGLLYKPEAFDESSKYPMMVYFYEKNSDLLHRHHAPEPHRSTINISFYVSRGYVVFVPDIVYKTGYPGESAMNSVMPGVTALVAKGFVDPDRIGVQGHSWGGYQIAYMVTRTNLFRAAEAGAPVANMVSAYGGIRWGTGISRMFQYERTQSRIGGSLWEYPRRYLENSPIFRIDDVETPLLIMHNDQDAAVPWYQGIELFVALRRLSKPAWLINYNGEPHWPTKYQNKRDWTIRMQQYFDYFLLGAAEPVWMKEGIPATQKGQTLGLELTTTDN